MATAPVVKTFHHKDTSTGTFLVIDESSKKCLVIDTCVDFNYNNCAVSHSHADEVSRLWGSLTTR